ncbi:hypothetical protein GXW82_08005 [Streptacidiphilus sp. 4-A2]|nr:hypothetical protein [Streptacidiphilus sp. 4-A2]
MDDDRSPGALPARPGRPGDGASRTVRRGRLGHPRGQPPAREAVAALGAAGLLETPVMSAQHTDARTRALGLAHSAVLHEVLGRWRPARWC